MTQQNNEEGLATAHIHFMVAIGQSIGSGYRTGYSSSLSCLEEYLTEEQGKVLSSASSLMNPIMS